MTKKELRKISLTYRTLASQMLKVDSEEEKNFIQMYFDYITNTSVIYDYIMSCHKVDYNWEEEYNNKAWNDTLELPSSQDELVDMIYQLLQYVISSARMLYTFGHGYTNSNKFADHIQAFLRKVVEPFVVAIRNFLEIKLIDSDDEVVASGSTKKTIFLSYCQKDSDIADLIDQKLGQIISDKATISRDIRDVEYHESFKRFMQSIEQHDYVITIISDNYMKSRNCMYEVLEVVKDSNYSQKLIHIVLDEEDKKYYRNAPENKIGANVYSMDCQTEYTAYWQARANELHNQIQQIDDPTYSISQAKELRHIRKILMDFPDFMDFMRENKGLTLSTHIEHDFSEIIQFMQL